MNTTLDFDDRLIRTARIRAAEEGETLTRLIERTLRDYLEAGPGDPARTWPTGHEGREFVAGMWAGT